MVYEFKFPDVGEGITKGTVVAWAVKEGNYVKEDQTIGQIETDKAVVDMPSPKTGTIEKLHIKEGGEVKVGETLVSIKEEGGPSKPPEEPAKKGEEAVEKKGKKKPAPSVVGELEVAEEKTALFGPAPTKTEESPKPSKVLATPKVRQLAKQKGIDISQVRGTGPEGSVTESDLGGAPAAAAPAGGQTTFKLSTKSGDTIEIKATGLQSVDIKEGNSNSTTSEAPIRESTENSDEEPKATVKKKYDDYGYIERVPFTGVRKAIAENLRKSIEGAVHVTGMEDIDVTELIAIQKKDSKKANKKGVKLTFLPYITRAAIIALEKIPILNASLDEENDEIILKKYYNMGYAVATEAGLMVVVVKRARHKTLYLIAKEIHDLAKKARERKIDLLDLRGSSFTITNYGSIGGNYATPIINPGESAILGIGRIEKKPVVVGNKVKIRYILPVSLTFDHRIADGADAAYFLQYLREELEHPKDLLESKWQKKFKDKSEIFDIS